MPALLRNPTVLIAMLLMAVIMMMVVPVPAWAIDIGLIAGFALAGMIFMVVLFVERPLEFSSFPGVLLVSLLLRLSLNVCSVKLIISEGHTGTHAAGAVIQSFAELIMGGNLVTGTVVFLVIMIVNFMVITKGAGRMAEVSARFALDAMPGKQLAIDADIASGAISHTEAKERRRIEQEETVFYGSLDGASKFVKGDAVAGLLITALNFIVGLFVGVFMHNMPIGQALHTYSLLTVGDGLVTQIPAVIISISSAMLTAKSGARGSLDTTVLKQFMAHPQALRTIAVIAGLCAILPGMPRAPFIGAALVLEFIARRAYSNEKDRREADERAASLVRNTDSSKLPAGQTLGDHMEIDDIRVEFSKSLIPSITDPVNGAAARITAMRRALAGEFGFILPEVRLIDNPALNEFSYVIKIHGVKSASGTMKPGSVLIIKRDGVDVPFPGEDTEEPVYGAPARWVAEDRRDQAVVQGHATASHNEIIATHLMETVKSNMRELLTRQATQRILDEFLNVSDTTRAAGNRKLLEDLIPDTVPRDLLQQVLRGLLEERVSVRNLPLILEGIAEAKARTSEPGEVIELVRRKLSLQIASSLTDPLGKLPLVRLSNEWEKIFRANETADGRGSDTALPPADSMHLADQLAKGIAEASQTGAYPAVAVPGSRRRMIRMLLETRNLRNPVLAFEELHPRVKPSVLATV